MRGAYIALRLIAAWLLLGLVRAAHAQIGFGIPSLPAGPPDPPKVLDHYPDKPSGQLAFAIPLSTIGFSTPGDNYLMRQESVVSLDFLDEERVLFTFHMASGLMARRPNGDDGRQRIRAMVIEVPTGKVETQAEWMVPDRARYLWMLTGGHFLLRTKDGLDEGDAQLKTHEYLHFPGKLMWIQMDPKQEYIVANSLVSALAENDDQGIGRTSKAERSKEGKAEEQTLFVRTIKRSTGEVVRETSVPWTSQKNDWLMNSEGYLERVHEKGANWTLKLSSYSGENGRVVGRLESTCLPKYSFVSDQEFLASRCDPERGWVLEAFSGSGHPMWQRKAAANAMWPIVIPAADGTRIAEASLVLKHAVEKYKGLIGARDLLGQSVKVFEAVNGSMLLEAPLTPVFDGGGNVAVSPSGRRVAILNAGAIQVFELPVAPQSAAVQ